VVRQDDIELEMTILERKLRYQL